MGQTHLIPYLPHHQLKMDGGDGDSLGGPQLTVTFSLPLSLPLWQ